MKRLIVCILLLCSACASLPTVNSISETEKKVDGYRFYDADSKIRYQLSHSGKDIHLRLNTTDRFSIAKILKTGLHIYFDPAGKKNKKTYIQYPLPQDKEDLLIGPGFATGPKLGAKQNLKADLAKIPHEFLFKQEGKEEQLLQAMLDSGIQLSMIANSDEELTYDVRIPFDKIGAEDLSDLSIGIVSGNYEKPEADNPPQQQQQRGPGGNQLGGNVGRMSRARVSPMERPVEIWFQLVMQ